MYYQHHSILYDSVCVWRCSTYRQWHPVCLCEQTADIAESQEDTEVRQRTTVLALLALVSDTANVLSFLHKIHTSSSRHKALYNKRASSYKFTSPCLVFVLGPQSQRKLSRTSHSANSSLCMITSINSITAIVHEVTVKMAYLLMSDITYWYV